MKKNCFLLLIPGLLLISCQRQKVLPKDSVVYIQLGDSITFGAKNNVGSTPGDFAVRTVVSPLCIYIKMGWPAQTANDFNVYHRKELLDSIDVIPPGHRIILGIAYGANDFPRSSPAQVLANILRVARWAHDTAHIADVLIIPVMNRKDKWGVTRTEKGEKIPRFNESRLWVNAQLHVLAPLYKGIRVANEADSPLMYADSYPDDTLRCADKVHPVELGAKELGEGTIAHGIASFGKISLR